MVAKALAQVCYDSSSSVNDDTCSNKSKEEEEEAEEEEEGGEGNSIVADLVRETLVEQALLLLKEKQQALDSKHCEKQRDNAGASATELPEEYSFSFESDTTVFEEEHTPLQVPTPQLTPPSSAVPSELSQEDQTQLDVVPTPEPSPNTLSRSSQRNSMEKIKVSVSSEAVTTPDLVRI